jgi:hypothetical protein
VHVEFQGQDCVLRLCLSSCLTPQASGVDISHGMSVFVGARNFGTFWMATTLYFTGCFRWALVRSIKQNDGGIDETYSMLEEGGDWSSDRPGPSRAGQSTCPGYFAYVFQRCWTELRGYPTLSKGGGIIFSVTIRFLNNRAGFRMLDHGPDPTSLCCR